MVALLEGRLTEEEEAEFDQWYQKSPLHREYFYKVRTWYGNMHYKEDNWQALKERIAPPIQHVAPHKRKSPYWGYGLAASVVLFITLSVVFWSDALMGPADEVIEIGSSKAVLTLDDGTAIPLQEGKAYTSGNI